MQQNSPAWSGELQSLMEAYQQAGGDPLAFQTPEVATLAVSGDQVLVSHSIPGVHLHSQPIEHGVRVSVVVDEGTQVKNPVHLCFGVLPSEGIQLIEADYQIGDHAQVQFLAHCSFPNAIRVEHRMNARIHVGKNASMTYTEEHYHGQNGGIEVYPISNVIIEEGGQLTTNFNITRGRVGKLMMDYRIEASQNSLTELVTKAFGSQDDHIRVQETIHLNGENAHSLTKTRIAVKDKAVSEVTTLTEGNAPRARGHMDCTEIVRDEAIAHNNPVVKVTHAQAQVTHEAAIGTVNRRELETLMARGLDEEEAVDLIIRAMIRG